MYTEETNYNSACAVKSRRKKHKLLLILLLLLAVAAAVAIVLILRAGGLIGEKRNMDPSVENMPDWIQQDFLRVNEFSRPGTPLEKVNGVVVHYVGNPGTTAAQNRSYFNGLAETGETSASSHFIVDTDGTIIQCVPLNEIAYCSNQRNEDTISIECCHPDETGKFTETELESLTKLIRWLADEFGLGREDVIRHYDVTGKECPKYFVDHPDEWTAYLDEVFAQD